MLTKENLNALTMTEHTVDSFPFSEVLTLKYFFICDKSLWILCVRCQAEFGNKMLSPTWKKFNTPGYLCEKMSEYFEPLDPAATGRYLAKLWLLGLTEKMILLLRVITRSSWMTCASGHLLSMHIFYATSSIVQEYIPASSWCSERAWRPITFWRVGMYVLCSFGVYLTLSVS